MAEGPMRLCPDLGGGSGRDGACTITAGLKGGLGGVVVQALDLRSLIRL